LLEERLLQYNTATNSTSKHVFLDRGIPDILAYMDYTKTAYPAAFCKAAASTPYDMVFLLEPWQTIHTTDGERYESFEQAQDIHKCILNTYKTYNYKPIIVPFGTVEERVTFITNTLAQ
jgi:predicted ATPase